MPADHDQRPAQRVLLSACGVLPRQLDDTDLLAGLKVVATPGELAPLLPELARGDLLLLDAPSETHLPDLVATLRPLAVGVRLIALSHNDDSEFVADCLHAGADDFLSLRDPLQIPARLSRLLGASRSPRLRRPMDNRFKTLADSAPALVWITDEAGEFIHFNRPWAEFTGRAPDREMLHGWMEGMHPEDRERFRHEFDQQFRRLAAFRIDFRLRRRDGLYRWITCHAIPHYEEDGSFTGYLGSCLDISDQHEAETLLAYRAITQTALASFGRFALGHNLAEIKQEATRLLCDTLQLDHGEILLFQDAASDELTVAFRHGFPESFVHGPMEAAEARRSTDPILRLDDDPESFPGRENHAALGVKSGFASPLNDGSRIVGFVTGLCREPRNFAREALNFLQSLATIISTVHQRDAAELALQESETKLLQSQKMEAVGQLAGGVAHDFNNLLTAVRCYADMLHDDLGHTAPELRGKTAEILKATARASALTRQLLAFSRRQVLRPETLDMNAVVCDLRDLVRSLLSEDISLDTRLSPEEACFSADRNQIDQVVLNLCLNARDAMQQGGSLDLSVSTLEAGPDAPAGLAPGPWVRLDVRDTGCGMPPEVQAKLFQPFFTTKPVGRGTGLGLATCAVIVKNCNGVIDFASAPGRGTIFSLYLPRISAPRFDLFSEEEETVTTGQERILVVEDDEAIRGIVQAILGSIGYQVTVLTEGPEALAHYASRPDTVFDLLLTDVIMPEMDGLELARRLKEQHQPGLRTLFMSGYLGTTETVQAVADYNLPFIEKPFTMADLARKVRETLDQPPAALPPRPAASP